MGHYAGLVHFGKEAAAVDAMPCFASASMLSFLEDNEPWAVMFRDGRLVPAPLEPTVPVHVGERLQLIGHVVPHRPDFTDALALEFRSPTGSLLYLPDIDNWDDWPALDDVVGGVDVALVDATFHSTDEHPGRDLSAIPHPLVGTTLRRFRAHLEDTRVILTHLNWTNPLSDPDSAAAAEATALGYEIAFDGMEVPV